MILDQPLRVSVLFCCLTQTPQKAWHISEFRLWTTKKQSRPLGATFLCLCFRLSRTWTKLVVGSHHSRGWSSEQFHVHIRDPCRKTTVSLTSKLSPCYPMHNDFSPFEYMMWKSFKQLNIIFHLDYHAPRHHEANKTPLSQRYIVSAKEMLYSLFTLQKLTYPRFSLNHHCREEKWIAPRRKYRTTMNVSLTETDSAPSHVAWLLLIAYIWSSAGICWLLTLLGAAIALS